MKFNRKSRNSLPLLCGIAVFLSALLTGPLQAQAQIGGATCTTSVLSGTYFYLLTGSFVSGSQIVPYAEIGKVVADGTGGIVGSSTASVDGAQQLTSFKGTYSIQTNCTGSLTITVNSVVTGTLTFQVIAGGQSFLLAASNPGVVAGGRAYRQTSSSVGSAPCGNGSLSGSYGYLLTGTQKTSGNTSFLYSDSGQLVTDGSGTLSTASVANFGGTGSPSSGRGSYSVASDCTATARVTNSSGTLNYLLAVVQDGQTVLFMGNDVGYTIAGTAQPQFAAPQLAVVNAASFLPLKLAPGSLFSLFGSEFSKETASARSLPLPRTLASTQVLINGQAIPLVYVGPNQINAQMPLELSGGSPVSVAVVNAGKLSNAVNINLSTAAPGVFTYGKNQAVVQNPDGKVNSDSDTARAGDFLVGYLTGGGPVAASGPLVTGGPSPDGLSRVTSGYSVMVGGIHSDDIYLGLTPQFVGLYQVNFKVPTLPPGRYPLEINVNGVVSNGPTISVSQ